MNTLFEIDNQNQSLWNCLYLTALNFPTNENDIAQIINEKAYFNQISENQRKLIVDSFNQILNIVQKNIPAFSNLTHNELLQKLSFRLSDDTSFIQVGIDKNLIDIPISSWDYINRDYFLEKLKNNHHIIKNEMTDYVHYNASQFLKNCIDEVVEPLGGLGIIWFYNFPISLLFNIATQSELTTLQNKQNFGVSNTFLALSSLLHLIESNNPQKWVKKLSSCNELLFQYSETQKITNNQLGFVKLSNKEVKELTQFINKYVKKWEKLDNEIHNVYCENSSNTPIDINGNNKALSIPTQLKFIKSLMTFSKNTEVYLMKENWFLQTIRIHIPKKDLKFIKNLDSNGVNLQFALTPPALTSHATNQFGYLTGVEYWSINTNRFEQNMENSPTTIWLLNNPLQDGHSLLNTIDMGDEFFDILKSNTLYKKQSIFLQKVINTFISPKNQCIDIEHKPFKTFNVDGFIEKTDTTDNDTLIQTITWKHELSFEKLISLMKSKNIELYNNKHDGNICVDMFLIYKNEEGNDSQIRLKEIPLSKIVTHAAFNPECPMLRKIKDLKVFLCGQLTINHANNDLSYVYNLCGNADEYLNINKNYGDNYPALMTLNELKFFIHNQRKETL